MYAAGSPKTYFQHKVPSGNVNKAGLEVVTNAVEVALGVGFRHIDGAKLYDNEKEVGDAIATSLKKLNLKREDIFVTSKVHPYFLKLSIARVALV
ncbi:Aldo-keto reductase family 1 member C23 [Taenia solium]|eukprot:TsM_000354400 transcript=TsM_000354400 gene=TsM_000354400